MHYRGSLRWGVKMLAVLGFGLVLAAAGVCSAQDADGAAAEEAGGAKALESVDIRSGRAAFEADGPIDRYRYFRLSDPPRLVVDIYGVKPEFRDRSYSLAPGFRQVRIGAYEDKTRLVFDAAGGALPRHEVKPEGKSLVVSWSEVQDPAPARTAAASAPKTLGVPATTVKDVQFRNEGGRSILSVELSGPAVVVDPVRSGNIVRFGIVDADINRALRRIIDTSAFPSAVLRITPYTALEKGKQEVRFAAELRGDVPYSLSREGNVLLFEVEDRQFAQSATPDPAPIRLVSGSQPATAVPAVPVRAEAPAAPRQERAAAAVFESASSLVRDTPYTGEKISLVFDDANIRNILQLIGEVGNLNIIAGEEVKGTVTLRLIDVPWDQALDLVMETRGLGMLRDGNVVRVLPREQIRAMRQAELTAVREERQLEPLTTEVISVSYADLGSISGPSRDLLTDRGKITPDPRNKQIIVTDIPSNVGEIRRLVRILDTPERQVMIEARIVEANSNFSRDLGVKWGISYTPGDPGSGDISRINAGLGGSFIIPPPAAGTVGSAGMGTGITFGRLGVDSTVLDLRISALETAGMGKVVSTPRVTTLNGGKALISQGTKIPYQSVSDRGTETKFENAELKLEVFPVINPDNSVILDIKASNSSVGATVPTGIGNAIAIDEKKAETKVLVRDGETTVIGGIFVEDERFSEAGVPGLMKVPILGHLFKSTTRTSERRELLVFITPRILN